MTDATQQTPSPDSDGRPQAEPDDEQETRSDDRPQPGSDDRQEPSTEDLQEPSTEKDVDEEPRAARPHDPEPDHQAVGIGVIGGPQTDTDAESDGAVAESDG